MVNDMNDFIYEYPIKTYFSTNAVKEYLAEAIKPYGKRVLLAYGGGSVKKTAATCILTPGCCKQLSREEILDSLTECM